MKNNSSNGYLEKCYLEGYPLLEASTVCVIKAAYKHDLKVDILDEARGWDLKLKGLACDGSRECFIHSKVSRSDVLGN